jgi:monovalent cation/hydrogen antiporter
VGARGRQARGGGTAGAVALVAAAVAAASVIASFGARQELQLLVLLVSAAALLLLAEPLKIPYPILLVLGGLVLGFGPGVPSVTLPPDVVLVGILPPLLYSAAYNTGLRELRQNLRPISLLALGLVTATTISVGAVAHSVIGLSWAASLVLGAIVSPTDPLAATEIGRRLGVPRRPLAVIEGESLVNDGTALVLFKFTVAAVVTGTFSLAHAAGLFVWTVLGGIAIGLAVGHAIRLLRRRLVNPPLEVMIAFLTGYFAFLPANAAGASGVLAVVTAGVYLGWYTPELTTVETRLQGRAFWSIFTFLMNALLFGLVGLQLRPILDSLSGYTSRQLVGYAVAVAGVVIVTRIVWVIPLTYLPRLLFAGIRRRDPYPPWQQPAFVGWTGMRGAVTLAAALAIPLATDAGTPFAGRDLIVFLAFCVVFATLVVQGLSMPLVIRALGLEDDGLSAREETKARIHAADAAIARLDELIEEGSVRADTAERLRGAYQFRQRRFRARFDDGDDGAIEERSLQYQRARRELLDAERAAIVALRNEGRIAEEVMHSLQRDLDLEDSRLDV